MKKKHNNPLCRTCIYRALNSAVNGCDYIVMEGHSRGTKVKDCDKYITGKRNRINPYAMEGSAVNEGID